MPLHLHIERCRSRCKSVQTDESNTIRPFTQPETLRALRATWQLFPDTPLDVFYTSLFPFKFPSKFCVSAWMKNLTAEEHAGIHSQPNLQSWRCQSVLIQPPHQHPTVLWKRPLLLMHMSGMTAGPPSAHPFEAEPVFSFVAVQLKHF